MFISSIAASFLLVKTMQDGWTVEIGAIGIEGVTDPTSLFSVDRAIVESVLEIPGAAFRIRGNLSRLLPALGCILWNSTVAAGC